MIELIIAVCGCVFFSIVWTIEKMRNNLLHEKIKLQENRIRLYEEILEHVGLSKKVNAECSVLRANEIINWSKK